MDIKKRIEKLEQNGWKYVQNYNTGYHILEEALVKRNKDFTQPDQVKEIKNGHIKKYR